jgi:hypothetical protein
MSLALFVLAIFLDHEPIYSSSPSLATLSTNDATIDGIRLI